MLTDLDHITLCRGVDLLGHGLDVRTALDQRFGSSSRCMHKDLRANDGLAAWPGKRYSAYHLPRVNLRDDSLDCAPIVQPFQVNEKQPTCKLHFRNRCHEF